MRKISNILSREINACIAKCWVAIDGFFIIVILRLKPTWNVQVYSHKNTVLRDKGQSDIALWMKYHRISQD